MTLDVRAQVRRYVEHVESLSEPVDVDAMIRPSSPLAARPRVPSRGQRPVRGWAYGLAAAVLVLLLVGGAAMLLSGGGTEQPVVTEPIVPTTTAAPSTTTAAPSTTTAAPSTTTAAPSTTTATVDSTATPPTSEEALSSATVQPLLDGGSVVLATVTRDGWPIVAVPSDGRPVVAFLDQERGLIMLAKCGNADCTAEATLTEVAEIEESWAPAMAVGPDRRPAIAYVDLSSATMSSTVKLIRCSDPECQERSTLDLGLGDSPVVAVTTDGIPMVLYTASSTGELLMVYCGDPSCRNPSTSILATRAWSATFAIRDDGRPIIAGVENDNLVFFSCDDPACTAGSTTTSSVVAHSLASWASGYGMMVAPDPDGIPAVVVERSTHDAPPVISLHYARCGDPDCADADAISEVQIHSAPRVEETLGASVVIDTAGLPVITWVGGSDLYVARCNNVSCAGAIDIETVSGCIWIRATVDTGADRTLTAYQLNPWERDGSIRLHAIGSSPGSDGGCGSGGGG